MSHCDFSRLTKEDIIKRLGLISNSCPSIPKLYYFDARGRAELTRLIFALKKIDYQDIRFRPKPYAMEDFQILKEHKSLPFGQVPLLEIDGMSMVQSHAIARYLARKYNLVGCSEKEAIEADIIACGTDDLRQKFTACIFYCPRSESEANLKIFENETAPKWAQYFEKLLELNNGNWFVGNQMTYADLAVYDILTYIRHKLPNVFIKFDLLNQLISRIESIEEIADWLKKRPVTPN